MVLSPKHHELVACDNVGAPADEILLSINADNTVTNLHTFLWRIGRICLIEEASFSDAQNDAALPDDNICPALSVLLQSKNTGKITMNTVA